MGIDFDAPTTVWMRGMKWNHWCPEQTTEDSLHLIKLLHSVADKRKFTRSQRVAVKIPGTGKRNFKRKVIYFIYSKYTLFKYIYFLKVIYLYTLYTSVLFKVSLSCILLLSRKVLENYRYMIACIFPKELRGHWSL